MAETEAILGPTSADVWVQADGTMVHGRTGALFEAKVGLVFRGVRRTGRTRRALIDRTYVAETADWTTFAERPVATCARLGVYDAARIFFASDGAAAIRWSASAAFPTAIELLDWYHLTEQLTRGIGLAYPDVLERAIPGGRARRRQAPPGGPRGPMPDCSTARISSRPPGPRRRSATSPRTGVPSPTIDRPAGQLGAYGERRRPDHLPALQAAWHELVPPRRQPPPALAHPPAQRHLGPLLGRAVQPRSPSLAVRSQNPAQTIRCFLDLATRSRCTDGHRARRPRAPGGPDTAVCSPSSALSPTPGRARRLVPGELPIPGGADLLASVGSTPAE